MGLFSDIALGGVSQLERGLGKRAALATAMRLLDSMPESAARDEAWLRAIELASELEDPALEGLAVRWASSPSRLKATSKRCRRLLGRLLEDGRFDAARQLAEAERTRTQGRRSEASAAYALGRALEQLGQTDAALRAYAQAARRSEKQPRLHRSTRARRVRLLARAQRRDEAAQEAAALLPMRDAAPEERLWVAAAALGSPGRYVRAAALDVLVELTEVPSLVPHVQRVAAQHAERFGHLTEPEVDRIRTLLASSPEARAALDALVALLRREASAPSLAAGTGLAIRRMLPRARAVVDGDAPGPRPDVEEADLVDTWLGLSIVHAARMGRGVEARRLLDELTHRVHAGARIQGVHWAAFRAAAADSPVRAKRLGTACLSRPGEPPSEGYLPIALTLAALGAHEDVALALQRAMRRREPKAKAQLAKHVRHLGWMAAEEGRRDDAIRLLREAKRLAGA